jgi:hypothetical protein
MIRRSGYLEKLDEQPEIESPGIFTRAFLTAEYLTIYFFGLKTT